MAFRAHRPTLASEAAPISEYLLTLHTNFICFVSIHSLRDCSLMHHVRFCAYALQLATSGKCKLASSVTHPAPHRSGAAAGAHGATIFDVHV